MDITQLIMIMGAGSPPTPVFDSVQHFTITIAASGTSNTATVSAVDTSKSFIIWGGSRSSANNADNTLGRVELTNSTTLTATRTSGSSGVDLVISGTLIESSHLVSSVQRGTISLSGSSATATISSVDTSRTAVTCLGAASGRAAAWTQNSAHPIMSLTNATTVTAAYNSSASGTTVVSYEAIEFNSGIVNSVQYAAHMAASGTSTTVNVTISSVTEADCMLLYAGGINSSSGTTMWAAELTSATNVALTRSSGTSNAQGMAVFVVELPSVFASVQNVNSAYVTTATSRDASISTIDPTKSFASYMGFRNSGSGSSVAMSTVVIKDADEVTFNRTGNSSDATSDLKARVNQFV